MITRRLFLLGGTGALALAACSDDDPAPSSSADTSTPEPSASENTSTEVSDAPGASSPTGDDGNLTAADFAGLTTCVLLPESTAGPFPLDEQFDRRDITEGYPGHAMRLGFRVVDTACDPVGGARVEIWHTDASGDYSAFADGGDGKDEGEGTTFLRGTQTANDDGIVEFSTIYPGWYPGRAVHIHLRVHVDGSTVLTSQVYFDDDYTLGVYGSAPYAEFGPPETNNERDGIAGDPEADGTLLHLTSAGPGTLALLNLGIAS